MGTGSADRPSAARWGADKPLWYEVARVAKLFEMGRLLDGTRVKGVPGAAGGYSE
jgi:hypothetical protein